MKIRHILSVLLLGALPLVSSRADIDFSINIAPPELPVYEQPPCPVEGYLWTPGYYAYGDGGYYFVDGVWVAPPQVGFLWTPGYWGYRGGFYGYHEGYWGRSVGFYGGVNYGYGYGGRGYYGGRWDGNNFRYNTAVTRVNTTVIHNTYIDKTVVHDTTRSRSSFNGPNGVQAKPTSAELAARGNRIPPTAEQTQHRQQFAAQHPQHAAVPQQANAPGANKGRHNKQAQAAAAPAQQAAAAPEKAAGRHGEHADRQMRAENKTRAPRPEAAPRQAAPHVSHQPHAMKQPAGHPEAQHGGQPQQHPGGGKGEDKKKKE